jgi:hypothetical protein
MTSQAAAPVHDKTEFLRASPRKATIVSQSLVGCEPFYAALVALAAAGFHPERVFKFSARIRNALDEDAQELPCKMAIGTSVLAKAIVAARGSDELNIEPEWFQFFCLGGASELCSIEVYGSLSIDIRTGMASLEYCHPIHAR